MQTESNSDTARKLKQKRVFYKNKKKDIGYSSYFFTIVLSLAYIEHVSIIRALTLEKFLEFPWSYPIVIGCIRAKSFAESFFSML